MLDLYVKSIRKRVILNGRRKGSDRRKYERKEKIVRGIEEMKIRGKRKRQRRELGTQMGSMQFKLLGNVNGTRTAEEKQMCKRHAKGETVFMTSTWILKNRKKNGYRNIRRVCRSES